MRNDELDFEKENPLHSPIGMTEKERQDLSLFIESKFGIKMPPKKKFLLQARLQKRLRELGFFSFSEYYQYLTNPHEENQELIIFGNAISTNKTDFFREAEHFKNLTDFILPEIAKDLNFRRPVRIWCAASSTGEEPYTIMMACEEYKLTHPKFSYEILASDISTKALSIAYRAVYDEARLEPVPLYLRQRYFLKSKTKNIVRVSPDYRKHVVFRRINLKSLNYPLREKVDIIFCRNVFIYFEKDLQEKIVKTMCRHLNDPGFLLIGHSESIFGYDVPLEPIAHTVYRTSHG